MKQAAIYSEALNFRVTSESFAPLHKLKRADLQTLRLVTTQTSKAVGPLYGKQILVTVSRELTAEYGRGFSYAEIARMVQFALRFADEAIVVTLSQQLSWSHFHALLSIKGSMAREFYAEMCQLPASEAQP